MLLFDFLGHGVGLVRLIGEPGAVCRWQVNPMILRLFQKLAWSGTNHEVGDQSVSCNSSNSFHPGLLSSVLTLI